MKKALSVLLALALLVGLAPAAFAAEEATAELSVRWLDYESVYWWSYAEGLLLYEQGGKMGFLRADGTPLTDAVFDNVGWTVVDGGIPVQNDWKWGKIDAATGALIMDFLYSTAQEVVAPVNARIVGTEGGPYAVSTLDGTLLSAYKYWGFAPFSYGLAAVWTADGWGYVDATGAEVIPCQYVSGGVEDFGSDGYAWVNGPEGYNIIDRTGREVFDAPKGKILAERPWRAGHGLWGFYGDNDLVGFVEADSGEVVIEPQYRLGTSPKGMQVGGVFNEAGYASVLDADGQEIAIDLNGQRADAALAAPDGESMAAHSGGLHPFMDNGKYGYMDESETVVVSAVFDYASDFWDGKALVQSGGSYGILSDPRIPTFSDVADDAWYAPYVRFVAENGIMIGTGGGMFEPERELTKMECLTLALRLYDLMRGGDGTMLSAPKDWGFATLTLSDGTVYSGYGAETTINEPVGRWRFYSYQGMMGYGTLRRALRQLVTKEEADRIYALEDKTATLELNGAAYTGAVHCWTPDGSWVMDFEVDATEDIEAAYAAIFELARYSVDPSLWYRDAVYTFAQRVPEAERKGLDAVSEWRWGNTPAARRHFASALAAAAADLEEINVIDSVPDIDDVREYEAAAILLLYRAGILNGVDAERNFAPEKTLTRAEAAAMVARVLDPALRIKA